MNTLYLIGNGFDLAHGLKTSYWDFRGFLDKNYPEFLREFERLYDIGRIDFWDPRVSDDDRKLWEENVKDGLWSDFEKKIGQPNISEMEDISESVLADLNLESGPIEIKDTMDAYWKEQYGYVKNFQQYVQEWIESIDTSQVKPLRKALIGSDDYFINFNYTDLLENVYQIENVLHIHGGVSSVAYDAPIMGHGNKADIEDYTRQARKANAEFCEGEASIKRAVSNYLKSIYKDTEAIIRSNDLFWDKLRDVNKVVIFGLSAGEGDLPYLRKILESVNRDAKWDVYYYDVNAFVGLNMGMGKARIGQLYVTYIPSDEFWD